ncbi:xylan 1,4-beta-xylosidase [Bryocella elongata]|uniref:Xylan 1,4-beta-xylosidase n=1 Tax=Bryocella elongata TaxID=863522 RepID=A0A1H6C2P5_9BACT|nr:beta-xylosidase [Bryocella elongata]SEG66967.1 xylan 1,4-beta-xylosidase [Bryocella elongata]
MRNLLVVCSVVTSVVASGLSIAAQKPVGAEPVRIAVDLDAKQGAFKPAYAWFGYDEANYTTMKDGRALLGELHDLTPAPVYIRAHHLLTSGDGRAELKFSSTNVYTEDAQGRPHYDFTLLDGIFDAWKAAGVKPMVELGFMPKDLAAVLPNRHEPYQVHYPASTVSGASNNPPKDYAKWEELCRVVTAHLVERYGRDEVLGWYFEVWNEPDIDYWHGSMEDYFKLYDHAVAGVRAALPGARVGGPATTSPRSEKARGFLKAFLDHVQGGKSDAGGGKVPLDFISFHAKGSPAIQGAAVTMGIDRELKDVDAGFGLIASYSRFKGLPIILSEADPEGCAACSSRVNPANNYRNGTLYPAYTAAAYKALLDLNARHGTNLISMLSWSFEFEDKEYFEGFRDLATNGIDKPILNLFRMLGMMGGERVAVTSSGAVALDTMVASGVRGAADVDALATRDRDSAEVLVWNYRDETVAGPGARTVVGVKGIPAGVKRVLVEAFRIDGTHSNAYTEWLGMGSPPQPDSEQRMKLKAAGQLAMVGSPRWLEVRDGEVEIPEDVTGESVSLLRLSWVGEVRAKAVEVRGVR